MASPLVFPPPVNPDDLGRGPLIMALIWIFTGIAMIAVCLRLYVRNTVTLVSGWDDWFMLAAMLCQTVHTSLVSVSYKYGLGKHDQDLVLPDQMVDILKWIWIASPAGMMVTVLARISIAILLVRLFGVRTWFKRFLISFTALQSLVCTIIPILTFVQVDPVEGLWNVFDPSVKHWDPRIVLYLEYLGQSMCTFSDLTYVLFPVIFVWKLKMAVRRKIGLIIMLGMSLITMSLSILKTTAAAGSSQFSSHIIYDGALGVLWSVLEQTFVIIMGCVPTLRGVTKLDLPGVNSISLSMASLIGRNRSKQSSINNGYTSSTSKGYKDLETDTYKLGQLGSGGSKQGYTATSSYNPDRGIGSKRSADAESRVRRVDEFSVSYDHPKAAATKSV